MTEEMKIPLVLTLEEAAKHLKSSVKTIRRRISSGEIKSFKEGGRVMILQTELASYLQRKIQTTSPR